MNANPFLGVLFHWLGGLAAGSFYVPYRAVRRWSWETYWLVGGVFSWIVMPWLMAFLLSGDVVGVLRESPLSSAFWCYFWGAMWGLGGLTFGLTMRYLGMSLGMAIALGYCAAFGTLMPPIFAGKFAAEVLGTHSGLVILTGIATCLAGIALAGMAGMSKEREMPEQQKKSSIKEFNFKKGLLVATFSGVMSASFAYGLAAGDPIKELALKHSLIHAARADGYRIENPALESGAQVPDKPILGPALENALRNVKTPGLKQVIADIAGAGGDPLKYLDQYGLWQGLPVLVVVLLGGFTTNFLWCLTLNIKNGTGYQYFTSAVRAALPSREQETIIESAIDAPGEEVAVGIPLLKPEPDRAPMLSNYFFCALAGATWYMQFFFYSMGETQMGRYGFSSWTLHMASIIIFSTLWGIALREWKGSSRRTISLVIAGLTVLIGSTIIVGYGNYLATIPGVH